MHSAKSPCHPEAVFWPKDLAVAFAVAFAVVVAVVVAVGS